MDFKSFSLNLTAVMWVTAMIAIAGATEVDPPLEDPGNELKPHFLYMKKLREQLSDSDLNIATDADSDRGRPVATSFETQSTGGTGEITELLALLLGHF